MNFSKKSHDIVRQNDKIMKTSQKHDANVQKNSTLYFQVGLILVLLAVHGLFEMNFAYTPLEPLSFYVEDIEDDLLAMKTFKVYEEKAVVAKPKKRKPVIFTNPIIKDNDDVTTKETDDLIAEPETVTDPPIDPKDLEPVIDLPEDEAPIFIKNVEQVPVYLGCEDVTTNQERLQCMQSKLSKLISRKFNKDLVSDLGLKSKQRISVQFKIDKSGKVTDIKSHATHERLKQEAKRVLGKVPQMTPGKQKDKAVEVIYSLPIILQVDY